MSFEAFPLRGEGDRVEVQRLWREYLGDPRIKHAIAPRWQWEVDWNPAGPARMCVVTDKKTGAVIGSAGALPRALRIDGQPVSGAVLCDFVVDRRYRVAGAAVALQRALANACFASGVDLLYGFPNDSAYPVFARVGYKTVGTAAMLFRPIRSAHTLRELVPPVIARAAGLVIDQVIGAYEFQLSLRHRGRMTHAVRARAGAEFQSLWHEHAEGHALVGERTPAYLNWRYAEHPIDDNKFFCLTEGSHGRLLGYVAYSALRGKLNVLDALWRSPEIVQPLFVHFLRSMRALGHASVSVCHVGDGAVADTLRRLAFVPSKQRRKFVCKVAPAKLASLGAAAHDARRWSLFDGELDI
jgi:hypothetical protein